MGNAEANGLHRVTGRGGALEVVKGSAESTDAHRALIGQWGTLPFSEQAEAAQLDKISLWVQRKMVQRI